MIHIEYKILPYLSKYSNIYFYSEDLDIADGDNSGIVYGLQAGSTRICVMAVYYGDNGEYNGLTKYLIVNVINPVVPEEPSEGDEGKPAPEEKDGGKPAPEEKNEEKPGPEKTDEGNLKPEEADKRKPVSKETDKEKPESEKTASPVDHKPNHSDMVFGYAAMPALAVRSVPAWNVEISADETIDMLREALLSSYEQLEAVPGKKISFTIELHDGEDKVSKEDKIAVKKAINSGILVKWLDISLYKQIEGSDKIKVERAKRKVKLQITAPDNILSLAASGTAFEVVSVVDGQVIRIPSHYNPKTGTIDFETDIFGVFALVYYDK